MKKWLLIYSKPKQEKVAAMNLERQGFNVYHPVIAVGNSSNNLRQRQQLESLFPSYLFIHVDPYMQSISPVRSTQGVRSFVRFGNDFAAAPQEIIDQIQCRVSNQTTCENAETPFKEGDKIKVNGNGFRDVNALFSNTNGSERALILLDILGKQSKMSVPLEYISCQ